ncbi:hypothetical protein MKL26_04810 [Streptococcus suis]|nr:hypothetical protein [Streptococcus suis]
MYSLDQLFSDLYSRDTQLDAATMLRIEKEIERWMIQFVYAPLKLREKDNMLKNYRKQLDTIADEAEKALNHISGQLDASIKGEFSRKVHKVIVDKAKDYQQL